MLPAFLSTFTFTPYEPADGWTYYVEAARGPWPSCDYRFLSFTSTCTHDDLWKSAGTNQEFCLGSTSWIWIGSSNTNTIIETNQTLIKQ